MKFKLLRLAIAFLGGVSFSTIAEAFTIYPDGLPHLEWKEIASAHQLPAHPVSLASSSDTGDFVAVISNEEGSEGGIYFLDRLHQHEGWQKKETFQGAHPTRVAFGLHHFYVFGNDAQTDGSIVMTSADNGATWSRYEMVGAMGHYSHAAFSETVGVATGREGAVVMTGDGVTWTQVLAPSGFKKTVYYGVIPSSDLAPVHYGFALLDASQKTTHGFLQMKDYLTFTPFYSQDGLEWTSSETPCDLTTFPLSQVVLYGNKAFVANANGYKVAPFAGLLTLKASDFVPISSENIPRMNVSAEVTSGGYFVAVGAMSQGEPRIAQTISVWSPPDRAIFIADVIPCDANNTMVAIAANTYEVLALACDGTSYSASLLVP